jgi:hypothetical protein
MRSSDLHKVWGAPDNSRLTAKQQSFRLPVHVAAKINALCDLYPTKTKTEIVGDLLAAALEEAITHLPSERGEQVSQDPELGRIFATHGPAVKFRELANKHYREMERELGNKNPPELYSDEWTMAEHEPE